MVMFFPNSSPKILKEGRFGPKFTDVYFHTNFCIKTNSRALMSNMKMVFSNSSPKQRKSGIFGSKFKDFFFCNKLCSKANSSALISNMTMVFQNCCLKHPNKTFLVPYLRIFIFALNFTFSKIRGYFKNNYSFFSNFSLKMPLYCIFGSKFKDYYFILLRLHELLSVFTK